MIFFSIIYVGKKSWNGILRYTSSFHLVYIHIFHWYTQFCNYIYYNLTCQKSSYFLWPLLKHLNVWSYNNHWKFSPLLIILNSKIFWPIVHMRRGWEKYCCLFVFLPIIQIFLEIFFHNSHTADNFSMFFFWNTFIKPFWN